MSGELLSFSHNRKRPAHEGDRANHPHMRVGPDSQGDPSGKR